MMADLTSIRKLIHGAVGIQEENGRIQLSRFTPAEREVYRENASYTVRTFAASGMRLEFLGLLPLDHHRRRGDEKRGIHRGRSRAETACETDHHR